MTTGTVDYIGRLGQYIYNSCVPFIKMLPSCSVTTPRLACTSIYQSISYLYLGTILCDWLHESKTSILSRRVEWFRAKLHPGAQVCDPAGLARISKYQVRPLTS